MIRTLLLIAALWTAALPAASAEETPTKLLRFPDIHGDKVVFVYAGDLWTAPVAGGLGRRLTAHPGLEQSPKFSPDGRWIAFNGQYDGDEQVYVIPAEGGEPKQLTFYPARGPLTPRWGFDNQVYGWTPDGSAVVIRSLRGSWDLGDSKIFTVPVAGGLPTALPMPESGGADLSPDAKQVVYSPLARDFRTWKRYQGGWAQELYIFDLASHDLRRVTDNPRADRDPMWIGDSIVFNSDRTGTFNLYAFDVAGGTTRQLTTYDLWDVRWPSSDSQGRIVYELDGELHVFDLAAGADRKLSIEVPDDGLARRPSRISAAGVIESFDLSPGGKRAVFSARGDIFTVPAENGTTRNLTRSNGAHDKWPAWSPDGKQIAFLSDRDGEEEIYLVDQAGGELRQLTDGGHAMRYQPRWSPDGERLAFSDKDAKLYVIKVADGSITEIARDPQGQLNDYSWSPHGGYLAFTSSSASGTGSIHVWSAADGKVRRITDEQFNDYSPAWSPDGNYLFYLSDRSLAPQIGSWEWNFLVNREAEVFALALRADVPHPTPPRSDEVGVTGEDDKDAKDTQDTDTKSDKKANKKDKQGDDKTAGPISIDFDGLADRVARLPIEGGNYRALSAVDGKVLYLDGSPFFYGRAPERQSILRAFSFEDREQSTVTEGVAQGYALSQDGKKVIVAKGGSYELMNVDGSESKSVSTAGLEVDRVPAEEWAQIFDEVWRRYRDFFYVENMHGYDWQAIGERYRALLPYVGNRSDLNYVLGEMIAELNIGHAYVAGGDYEIPERPKVALLGAEIELDPAAGRYRIAKILPGDNHEERYRSPLTEVGVHVAVGDYLLAIDGQPLTASDNPYRMLRHKAGQPVTLQVNSSPKTAGARDVQVQPISTETGLRYYGWVDAKRQKVEEMSGGRLGYLHLPDMGADGIREFIKWYYGQIRKEGLVVDVRNNGGGNVSQMVIERLSRQLLGYGFSRTAQLATTYPVTVFTGPMACVLDEDSSSDGDIFPYMFRRAGLGPLIGKRSWGGVVGIADRGSLIDGGQVFVPEFGLLSAEGEWIIEGHGVDPDIVVDNDPKSVIEGRDPQLERAVQEVLKQLEDGAGKPLPARPAAPVKTQ